MYLLENGITSHLVAQILGYLQVRFFSQILYNPLTRPARSTCIPVSSLFSTSPSRIITTSFPDYYVSFQSLHHRSCLHTKIFPDNTQHDLLKSLMGSFFSLTFKLSQHGLSIIPNESSYHFLQHLSSLPLSLT